MPKPTQQPEENRVHVHDYDSLLSTDPRLIPVASVDKKVCKLHALAAAAFTMMIAACYMETGLALVAASGWRPRRWLNRAQYEQHLLTNYAYLVAKRTFKTEAERRAAIIAEGRKYIAFESPHQTGLAVDFGSCGLEPVVKTRGRQRELSAYRWLCENAHRFGWTPYNNEPWHWEYNCGKDKWSEGV